ncbi:hypothetical protein CBS63078_9529 [Aspergillus niger]|nr:hypothetical protein CBS133816_9376 [Aspergillus niger]KAI2839502.1 hypothetical protein CBS12448_10732 [Aspergillus niger]KAI2891985.1 hypothetical protein CBS63078_9529 [Aspergillus niger]KAI2896467.1 hypothetical protein CBS11852_4378 [Aspergillus niger]KAI2902666.1 hypothetical protein CBS13152_1612 [Aspergillus niger]
MDCHRPRPPLLALGETTSIHPSSAHSLFLSLSLSLLNLLFDPTRLLLAHSLDHFPSKFWCISISAWFDFPSVFDRLFLCLSRRSRLLRLRCLHLSTEPLWFLCCVAVW